MFDLGGTEINFFVDYNVNALTIHPISGKSKLLENSILVV